MNNTEARLRELLDQAIAATDESEVERLLTEFRIAMSERVADAKAMLRSKLTLLQSSLDPH